MASSSSSRIPGRGSIVARIEGSDPTAPTLCLMGHTDVVPVNPAGWSRDPFGGELIDGEVWGRGAIDMLNITASMAVAFRHLADSGWRPKGTLIYFGVADEEAGGTWGAEWMCDNHWDAIRSDYVLTEMGGWSSVGPDNVRRVVVNTGEKGIAWRRLRVHGHARRTARCRSAPTTRWSRRPRSCAAWPQYRPARADQRGVAGPGRTRCRCPTTSRPACSTRRGSGRRSRRCRRRWPAPATPHTHTTFSPNVAHGGQKTNIIPDVVELEVDIRTVPGTTRADVDAHLHEALGELAHHVEISPTCSRRRRPSRRAATHCGTRSPARPRSPIPAPSCCRA